MEAPPKARSRFRWLLLGSLAFLALLAAAPALSSSWVRGRIEGMLEEELGGTASIGDFSYSLLGNVSAEEIRVLDAQGDALGHVGRIRASVGLLASLLGTWTADVVVEDFELHLRRGEDGWNLAGSPGEREEEPGQDQETELPDLRVGLSLVNGSVVVHGERATERIGLDGIQVRVPGLGEESSLELEVRFDGEAGEEGTLKSAGTFVLAPRLADARGQLGLRGHRIPLALFEALAPVDGPLFEAEELAAGVLDCSLELQVIGEQLSLKELSLDAGWLRLQGRALLEGVLGTGGTSRPEVRDSQFQAEADLARVRGLVAQIGLETTRLEGLLKFEARAAESEGRTLLSTEVNLNRFALGLASEEGEPFELQEPELVLSTRAQLPPGLETVGLEELRIASSFLQGVVTGTIEAPLSLGQPEPAQVPRAVDLAGNLTYVPSAVARILGDRLPGELSGDAPEPLTFRFDGPLTSFDPWDLLARSQWSASAGIGRFQTPSFDGTGTIQASGTQGQLQWQGDFEANRGNLVLSGSSTMTEERSLKAPTVSLGARDVAANSNLSPALSLLHPTFAAADALAGNEVSGSIDCTLELAYTGPLSVESLGAGLSALPLEYVQGQGTFSIDSVALAATPLIQEMLSRLGRSADKTLRIRPITFSIQDGRLRYQEPWTWTLAGTQTTFTGSVGLDKSLDLSWNLPIGDALVEKYDFLDRLRGETLVLPIQGTAMRPKLAWDEVVGELATMALKAEVTEGLSEKLGLGGSGGDDDPAEILRRADRLWSAGEKAQAAKLYQRIREDFKLSIPYLTNRDRIKERARFKE